ncbi:MAG: YggT family protein [Gammaproteobacteria bacterium]|nr:YggT family protein [Gammaproteobacteria bacterium]
MQSYLATPLEFLVTTLFDLYITVVMLRFILQQVRADFYNPISQFIVKVTNPPLIPLRRIIPGWGGIDIASIVLMLVLQSIAFTLLLLIRGMELGPLVIINLAFAELVSMAFSIFIFAIIIQVIISWINPAGHYNPVGAVLRSLTEPMLRPARRYIPPISGIDLSPLAALMVLQLLKMLIVPLLRSLSMA